MSESPPRRKNSLRLAGYNYASSGAYFVTICTHRRLHTMGAITEGVMAPSPLGELAAMCWHAIPAHYPMVALDVFVVMPNHRHGILVLHTDGPSLSHVIGSFKAAVTHRARRAQSHDGPVWQRNFHDRIIRNQREYEFIATYVQHNPALWEPDVFYR